VKRARVLRLILECIVLVAGIYLCFRWYDWKLFVVIFLLLFANNLNMASKIEGRRE